MLKVFEKKKHIFDYVLTILLLCLSGNPVFIYKASADIVIIITTLILLLIIAAKRKKMLSERFFVVIFIFIFIFIVQCVSFDFWPWVTFLGFMCRLFIGFAVIKLVKNFPMRYVKAMCYIALISFFFHGLSLLSELIGLNIVSFFAPIDSLFSPEKGFHVGLHNYLAYGRIPEYSNPSPWRNSSFFWEPGAFAGYLILAMLFLTLIKNDMQKKAYKNYFIILSIALLSTLSTMGYIAYIFILLLHFGFVDKVWKTSLSNRITCVFILPVMALGAFYSYYSLPFMKEKIDNQLFKVEMNERGWHRTRLGTLIFDWDYIKRRPLEGWGVNNQTRYLLNPEFVGENEKMGNGFTNFLVKMGIIGMFTWLYFIYKSFMELTFGNSRKTLFSILILFIVLQGEIFLTFPLFLGLMFLHYENSSRGFNE